jgi:capsular exopolysaccharide synthesis family protein
MEPTGQFGIVARGNAGKNMAISALQSIQGELAEPIYTWEQAVRVLRNNRNLALLLAGLLTLATVLGTLLMKDIYQPTARLEIDPVASGIRTLHEIDEFESTENHDYLETQAQILQSDALAVSVIRALHLDRNPEFVSKRDIAKWREPVTQAELTTSRSESERYLQDQLSLANRTPLESIALFSFHNRLSVSPIRNSRLIEVSFTSHDPGLAQQVTNTLITQYVDLNYRTRYATTMEVSSWLSKQLNDLREKWKQSNQAVTDYQKKYDLIETDDHDVPLAQLMSEVNHQLSDAQASRIEAEAYVRMIDDGHTEALPSLREDPLYQELMSRYTTTRTKLAEARVVYGDDSATVKKLESESAELSEQIEKEKKAVLGRLRATYAASLSREEMMLQSRAKLKAQMGDASSHMVAYRLLKSEALANAQLFNTLQGRLSEAGIYAGLKSGNIHVVDLAARLPYPTGPNRRSVIVAGAILSVLFSLIVVFARESLDNKVRTPDDIQTKSGLASLAMLPSFEPKREAGRWGFLGNGDTIGAFTKSFPLVYSRQGQGGGAEAMRNLRTALMFSRPGTPPRSILVSSALAGEGKSTVAMNLAAAMSQQSRTCLIECDLRHPVLAQTFRLRGTLGLSHVLIGAIPKEKALVKIPELPGLSVLPSGADVPNPGDLIASQQMQELLAALKNEFDFVVIDSPPVIAFSDSRFLSTATDAVVLVARYGFTTHRAITRCSQLLNDVHAPVVGVVLNDIDLASPDYHYYYYGYSKSIAGDSRYNPRIEITASAAEPSPEEPKSKSAHA